MKKGELNQKQEMFCQNYALLGNASGSAKEAGYSSTSAKVTGHKLLQMPKVLERIEELQGEMTTSYDVIAEVEAQYKYAKAHGHTSSALKALEILSKVRGVKSEETSLSEEAVHSSLLSSFYVIGREKIMAMMDEAEAEALGSGTLL
jgi:phage terminase small subunit